MTTKLEQAARALLAHWDTPIWKDVKPTADLMADLREALAEQAEQEPSIDFNKLHEMNMQYVECPACGSDMAMAYSPKKQAEQEPVAWMDLHKELGKLRWMGGDEGWDNAINAVRDRLVELAAPVRTKDLTDDEIRFWIGRFPFLLNEESEKWVIGLTRAVIAAFKEKNK